MGYLLFAPAAQLPILAGLACLVLGERLAIRRARKTLALPLLFVGCWTLCLLSLWESDFHTNLITGLGIALTLGIQVACLNKTASLHRATYAMLLNVLVASVLVLAFPIVIVMLACGFGHCF